MSSQYLGPAQKNQGNFLLTHCDMKFSSATNSTSWNAMCNDEVPGKSLLPEIRQKMVAEPNDLDNDHKSLCSDRATAKMTWNRNI